MTIARKIFASRRKLSGLLILFALCAGSAQANDYYVVVPVKGKTGAIPTVTVALRSATLPAGAAGEAYAGFDFNSVLSVSGDPGYAPGAVTWSAKGSVPAGLALGANGRLSGTPTGAGASDFTVVANYKGNAGQQAYSVVVAPPSTKVYGQVVEGGTLTLTAPAGTVFREVAFASYGRQTGAGPNYVVDGCTSQTSVSKVSEAFLGKSTGSIVADNKVFGDPCPNTPKGLSVTLKAY